MKNEAMILVAWSFEYAHARSKGSQHDEFIILDPKRLEGKLSLDRLRLCAPVLGELPTLKVGGRQRIPSKFGRGMFEPQKCHAAELNQDE